jgi:hypothetical protein
MVVKHITHVALAYELVSAEIYNIRSEDRVIPEATALEQN